jgi:hypothetical protein
MTRRLYDVNDIESYTAEVERGRLLAASGAHLPRGELLGHLEFWGIDVYEGSPQPWIDALLAERKGRYR